MMEFVREVKGILGTKIKRLQLWKWKVRPGKDSTQQAHHAAILHKRKGKIGKDTHYFTLIEYCDDKYMIFDTVTTNGRDVSADFRKGELVAMKKITEEYSFKYSSVLGKEPKKCRYDQCVVECISPWMVGKGNIAQKNVPGCLTGISL